MSRYKKVNMDWNELPNEARLVSPFVGHIWTLYLEGSLSALHLLQIYTTIFMVMRKPKSWFQKQGLSQVTALKIETEILNLLSKNSEAHENQTLPLFAGAVQNFARDLESFLSTHAFKYLPGEILDIFRNWKSVQEHLLVLDRIPSPLEVLKMQAQGKRCVTLFSSEKDLSALVDGKRDGFEFLLHDLSHAAKFFLSPAYQEQIHFFKRVDQLWEEGLFKEIAQSNPLAMAKLEYVMSDMNSHPTHLQWTLFSIKIEEPSLGGLATMFDPDRSPYRLPV